MPCRPLAFQIKAVNSMQRNTAQRKQKVSKRVNSSTAIQQQLDLIQNGTAPLEVVSACRLNEGILTFSEEQKENYIQIARTNKPDLKFFIPASGSGSRMFEFLYDFVQFPSPENHQKASRFFSRLPELALFRKLPSTIQEAYFQGTLSLDTLISFLLEDKGLNYGKTPKGLVPFHVHEPFVLNPFQEHILQAAQLGMGACQFHFTIQQDFETAFQDSIQDLKALTAASYSVSYSTQDPATDAYVFKTDGTLLTSAQGEPIRRPAGHGTLLQNLQALNAQYILVKNIDNVQHFTQQEPSNLNWEFLVGLQIDIRTSLQKFIQTNDFEGLSAWNQTFQLWDPQLLQACTMDQWKELLNRPLRVCGMVRNDGQPGGGPFFVKKDGIISKQIIEKSQLMHLSNASQLFLQSTHFNPVLMVLSPCDLEGKPQDLAKYRDPATSFIVEKNQQGEKVKFVEQPGLWNGSMAEWNTLFVEVPSQIFSPVKTVLDLLENAHLANNPA